MPVELVVLRLVHILSGIIWVGSTIFMAWFLMPAIGMAGAAGGQVMVGLQKRKLLVVMPIVAILTMLSGIRLMMIVSSGFNGSYFRTPMGQGYSIAALLAIIGFLVGMIYSRPNAAKLARLQHSAVSDQTSKELIQNEIKATQTKLARAGTAVFVLLTLAAAGMAVSRYLTS